MSDPTTAELIAELSGLLERVERYRCAPPLPNLSPELHSGILREHEMQRIAAVMRLHSEAVRLLPSLLGELDTLRADVQSLSAALLVEQERRAAAEAEREELRRKVERYQLLHERCTVCECELVEPMEPPHCHFCTVEDEHEEHWLDALALTKDPTASDDQEGSDGE